MRYARAFGFLTLTFSIVAQPLFSESERRVALVVGNNSYQTAPLQNAVNDARSISRVLQTNEFDVIQIVDGTLEQLERSVDAFVSRLQEGDVALFYYSGHGIQIEGENYIIPADFQARDEGEARHRGYAVSRLLERLGKSQTRLNLIILDACRDNPFSFSRSGARGLAPVNAGKGTYIAFATSPGSVAFDNPREQNGLFTKYLLASLSSPLNLDEMFSQVRERVYNASGGRQLPWSSSSVIGAFYFKTSRPQGPSHSSGEQAVPASRLAEMSPVAQRSIASKAPDALPKSVDVSAILATARVHLRAGAMDHAFVEYSRVLVLDSSHKEAYASRGIALLGLKRPTEALFDLSRAIALDSNNHVAYYFRSLAHHQLGRAGLATEDCKRARQLQPKFQPALRHEALLHFQAERLTEARTAAQQALALAPEDSIAKKLVAAIEAARLSGQPR